MRNRDRIAAVLVVVTLAVALLAIGSVLRWGVLLSAVLATACCTPYLTSKRYITNRSPLLVFLGLAWVFTFLQVLPLPAFLVKLMSPGKYELIAGHAKALGDSVPALMSLSYDPAATLLELAKLTSYVLFAFACLRLSALRPSRVWLCMGLAGLGALLAVIAHAHELMGLTKLYGVYTPSWRPRFLSPLLNENHLAAFLAMTAPVALALAVHSSGPRRIGWVSAVVVSAMTVLLSGSRGGIVVLAAGLVITGVLLLLQRTRGTRDMVSKVPMSVFVPACIVALCVCVLLAALTAGGVAKEFAKTGRADIETKDSKLHIWREAGALIRANRWTGVGRGGFESAFTRVHHSTIHSYSHVENEYLQAVLDWGLPAAAAMSLAMILVLVSAARRWQQGPLEAGALGGLAAIGMQSTVDFSIEFPSVALAAIAMAAVVLPPKLSKPGSRSHTFERRARVPALVVAALILAVALTSRSNTAGNDARALQARMLDSDSDVAATIAQGRRAMKRHPADYVIAGLTAQAMFRAPEERAKAFAVVKRALVLNPQHAGLNQLAARMLLNATPPRVEDALIQYAVALEHVRFPRELLTELNKLFPNPKIAARGLPLNAVRAELLCNHLVAIKAAPLAYEYTKRLSENLPTDPRAFHLLALSAFNAGKMEQALEPGRRSYELRPTAVSAVLLAKIELGNKNSARATKVLTDAVQQARRRGANRDIIPLLLLKVDVLFSEEKYKEAKLVAKELLDVTSPTSEQRGRVHMRLSNIEVKLGNPHQAAWERKRAKQLLRR